ncbi:bifunctional oligoribonuclease/PAP phosphatase NrnA [Lachnospiraceae bacterium 62-35]
MSLLQEMLQGVKTAVILGHIHPDGDCIGSCLGLYNYIKDTCPEVDIAVYLEPPAEKFGYMRYFDEIRTELPSERTKADLCFCLDSGDRERLGSFLPLLEEAENSLVIDHHITNMGYGRDNIIVPSASSTCEVLFDRIMEEEAVSKETAECLYTGIIHDTGVFQHSNTSAKTMEIAGKLIEKGIGFSDIITNSFYKKTYVQNQILGRALLESITFLGGRCIFSVVRKRDMDFYHVDSKDMDGIIDQLRVTDGVECAIFMYETASQEFKVSMRSNHIVDVSKVAAYFGGGGHIRAAGCTMSGRIHDVINNLSLHIEKQLEGAGR